VKIKNVLFWLKTHILIVACVIVGAIMVVAIEQRMSYLGDLNAKIRDSQSKVDKMRANTRAAATLPEDLKKVEGYNTRINESLFDSSAKALNLAYFYDVGSKIGIVLTRVEQSTPADSGALAKASGKNYGTIRFGVTAEGGIGSIVKFVHVVRVDHPMMRIERLSLVPASSKSSQGVAESMNVEFTFLAVEGGAK
jgi:hypothetical protein